MKRNYNELFQTKVEKYEGLEDHIISKINKIRNRRLIFNKSLYVLVSIISLTSLIYISKLVVSIFMNSGIYEYLSLFFVDITVLIYWKELLYSIIEAIPYTELSILLGFISLFIWSLRKITKIKLINNYGAKIIY
jgi:hypothetical protein